MTKQTNIVHVERVEVIWRGVPLGSMRGEVFCPERFSMAELQELANSILDELSPRRRCILNIVEHVCIDLGVEVDRIYVPRKQTERTNAARNLSVFFACGFFPCIEDTELAAIFQRTRSCMSHARKWVADRRSVDREFDKLYHRLLEELRTKFFPKAA